MITLSRKKSYTWLILAVTVLVILGVVVLMVMNAEPIVSGANGTLRGRVLDENRKTIRGARVFTYLPDNQTVQGHTDWRGRFQLTGLPSAQTVEVNVFYTGYGHNSFKGLATGGKFDLQIFPHGYELFGKQAPPLQVEKWFNSQPQSLPQLRDKVVVLHVGIHIDSYDRYNRKVLQMHEKYTDRGLNVIAVYINSQGNWLRRTTEEEISAYLKEHNIDFPVGQDKAELGTSGATYKAYGAKASPAKFLIDKKGMLRCSPTDKNLEKWVTRLLAE